MEHRGDDFCLCLPPLPQAKAFRLSYTYLATYSEVPDLVAAVAVEDYCCCRCFDLAHLDCCCCCFHHSDCFDWCLAAAAVADWDLQELAAIAEDRHRVAEIADWIAAVGRPAVVAAAAAD